MKKPTGRIVAAIFSRAVGKGRAPHLAFGHPLPKGEGRVFDF
ncbi:MAG: hypothetical protein ACRD18_07430 [Terriglobia bacterium]